MIETISQTLVVGANGRVGRLLTRSWTAQGRTPVLQHRGGGLDYDGPQLHWEPLSPVAPGVTPLGRGGLFRSMVVLAGVVPGRGDLDLNAQLVEACCRAADAAGIPQVLLASSAAVYGTYSATPYRETDDLRPVSPYGRAKVAAEATADAWRARGLQVTALRIGNVAGADALLTSVLRPLQIDRFADGTGPMRSYIGPETMARVIADLVGRDLPEVLNLAAPSPVAMSALAQAAELPWTYVPAPDTAHQTIVMNCDRLAGLVDFDQRESLAEEIVAEWQNAVAPA